MKKLLYIKANIKPEGQSRTFQVADSFVEEYRRLNPNDEVTTLDLYNENIDFLRQEDLGAVFGEKTEESKNHPILKYAYQIADADKIIVAAPMWNLGAPAIVKAYFDYVSVTGITFKYTAQGPVGTCKADKALIVSGRGGNYSSGFAAELEMGERYLRAILSFFGVKEIKSVAAESLDVVGMDVEKILADTIAEAKEIAKDF
ncbi:NAD(P)H-dependent oxidoreductase [Clostridium sp. AL.422]|uniref:FMN-dependent NADH-azoreductase n=1 Tax=Clostridium TaxID=1485 RepID=UPI00293DBAA0|nr:MULTISPECIES: NAD(P)H-dependent oxidoreductase [unclassified Clostridium]MDV4152709.1 NAD(P)H-dependent oxidoreductase [Clostridium sp. AL.422]